MSKRKTGSNAGANNHRELRSFNSKQLEVRVENGQKKITGWAIVHDSPASLGDFTEYVKPGAADASIKRDNVIMLWNHNSDLPLASVRGGTLILSSSAKGVYFEAILPESPLGDNAYESVKRGDIQGVSFGFSVNPRGDAFKQDTQGNLIRELSSITVYEISPCTFPAYPATSVDARAIRQRLEQVARGVFSSGAIDDDDSDDEDPACDPDSDQYDPEECDDEDRSREGQRCECRCGLRDCASLIDEETSAARALLLARLK